MFSLQPGDELVFGFPTTISQTDKIPGDLIMDHVLQENNIINFSTSNNRKQVGRQPQFGFREGQTETREDYNIKRLIHRDIERKRRLEMSKLCASLRSLLPLEYIKGKRSMCDHMQETMNYIKHMQKNIQDLRIRRDKLKKLSNLSGKKFASSSSNGSNNLPNSVTVNLASYGLEILISSSINSSEFRLSQVLALLMERELNVVSCVSTRGKEGFLHNIQVEASDMTSLDPWVLQERLTNALN